MQSRRRHSPTNRWGGEGGGGGGGGGGGRREHSRSNVRLPRGSPPFLPRVTVCDDLQVRAGVRRRVVGRRVAAKAAKHGSILGERAEGVDDDGCPRVAVGIFYVLPHVLGLHICGGKVAVVMSLDIKGVGVVPPHDMFRSCLGEDVTCITAVDQTMCRRNGEQDRNTPSATTQRSRREHNSPTAPSPPSQPTRSCDCQHFRLPQVPWSLFPPQAARMPGEGQWDKPHCANCPVRFPIAAIRRHHPAPRPQQQRTSVTKMDPGSSGSTRPSIRPMISIGVPPRFTPFSTPACACINCKVLVRQCNTTGHPRPRPPPHTHTHTHTQYHLGGCSCGDSDLSKERGAATARTA